MHIDVFHDTACPWCRIGKQHLRTAIAQWMREGGAPVTVTYRSFFLNPAIPPEGYGFREYMHAKGGGRVALEDWFDAPRQAGARAGIIFDFERIDRAPNTLLSHQLIAAAPDALREAMIDALYDAYFQYGQDIGDRATLITIAQEVGMDADTATAALDAADVRASVLADIAFAEQVGITGVPFFIVGGRLAFSGAQPADRILNVLKQAAHEQERS